MNDPQAKKSHRQKAPWLPAVLLIFVQAASGMREIPQFAFFLIYLQERLGLTPVAISTVVAGAQFAGMATALLGGAIAARLGAKWVLVGGLALSGLGSLVFQVPAVGLVTALWFVGGAGAALVTVGGASYLTRIGESGGLGILAAFYALSTTIGGAIGNPLAGILIERSGFQAFSWAAIALSAGILLTITFWMPHYPVRTGEGASLGSLWRGMLAITRQTNVRLVVLMRCLPTIYYGMLSVHIPLLLNSRSGSKVMVAAYITTTLIVASAAQLLAGRVADRRGARLPSLAAYSALVCSGLGLVFQVGSVWGLFVFGVLGNAAAWSLSTMLYVWVNDGIPKADHPAAFGLLHAVWSLSMISGSVLGGWSVPALPGLPFLTAGLFNVASLFLIRVYYARNLHVIAAKG